MKQFRGICLITRDVQRLRAFYETVLQVCAEGDDTFATFLKIGAELAISSALVMEHMAPGSMNQTGTGSYTLEFEVDDVDGEYERLKALNIPIVKAPTTQGGGLRSVWFRDPDANLVNFYMRVAGQ